jgi:apolipoprotein N-acyltransferase
MAGAFPPFGASILAPFAVAALTLSVLGTSIVRSLLIGVVGGVVFFAVLLRWVALVGGDAWIALSVFCALWFGLQAMAISLVGRLPAWPLWVASVWVLQEALRDRIPLGGFPWGRLAFAQTATTITPWAAIGGAALVTFVTALCGALIAAAFLAWKRSAPRHSLLLIGLLLVIGFGGIVIPRPDAGETMGGPATTNAAVVQGGVPSTGLGFGDERREVLQRHVDQTLALSDRVDSGATSQPDFVIWPENSSDIDPLRDAQAATAISRAADAIAVPILVGAVLVIDDTSVANVSIVWDPESGPGEIYTKQRPVPFGEYVPFRPILTQIIGRFDRIPRDFIAGDESGVLLVGDARLGIVICFEVAYDDVVRNAVTEGGRAIVVQTNNATFAGLGQPEQQIAMSRLRAVEFGRTVLVAATSGISAIIDPAGRLLAEAPEGAETSLVATIPLRDSMTIAARVGEAPEFVLAAIAVIAGLVAIIYGRRFRPSLNLERPATLSRADGDIG